MKEQVCSLQQMEKQLFKLNERVIDYSDLVQSYVIFPLLKNQGFASTFHKAFMKDTSCGSSSVGRALASQAKGHEFESRLPLTIKVR